MYGIAQQEKRNRVKIRGHGLPLLESASGSRHLNAGFEGFVKYGDLEKIDIKEFMAHPVEKALSHVMRNHVRMCSGKKCRVIDALGKEREGRSVVECIMVTCFSCN